MIKVKSNSSTVTNIMSACVATLETTVRKLETTRAFYKNLSSIIKTFKAREDVITGGDFNAKTKSKFKNYLNHIIGKYGKSGERFIKNPIQYCKNEENITFLKIYRNRISWLKFTPLSKSRETKKFKRQCVNLKTCKMITQNV